VNALGSSILFVAVVTVLFAPKRWALMGMMAGILYLTQAQRVDVAGFNFYAVRFVELAGFFRVLIRKELSFSELTRIDLILGLLYFYTVSVYLMRPGENPAYVIGLAVDAILSYFAFRGLITDAEGLRWFLRALIILLAPFAALVLIETFTSQNPFSVLGAENRTAYGDMWFRDGRLRALASFGHSSLMGTIGGSFLPLYIGLWFNRKDRPFALISIGLCTAIVWASNSGGPLTCVAVTMLGWILWTIRTKMRWVRRSLVGTIVLLGIIMKAPIWYLLTRIGNIAGGDSFHRAVLLDVAFQNLDKWWLAGMRTLDTASWLPYTNSSTGAVDMTNHFLVLGITAGLGSMFLFVVLLTLEFKNLGRALAIIRSGGHTENNLEYLYWGLGVMLGVHVVNLFGITYWDQSNVVWFMHLAAIASLTETIIQSRAKKNSSFVKGSWDR
jgi:hypothetical protein